MLPILVFIDKLANNYSTNINSSNKFKTKKKEVYGQTLTKTVSCDGDLEAGTHAISKFLLRFNKLDFAVYTE